jgi:glycosyltransferase involved in cell wall biosynthesis
VSTPLVSVIVPNFNHSEFLAERMTSILSQTFQDFEIIILDDKSTDNSREVIEQYRNNSTVSKIIYNEQNSGSPFIQWNKGIECANGKYIWIAESDDVCDSNFLHVLVGRLEQDHAVTAAYCKSARIDEFGNKIDFLEWWYNDISPSKWEEQL